MTVALLPDYEQSLSRTSLEPLATAPNYVRTRNATRWHRPRSGRLYDGERQCLSYWCGQHGSYPIGVEELPQGEDLCATCEGRFIAQKLMDEQNQWVFGPYKSRPPRLCPASKTEYWLPEGYTWGPFICDLCCQITRARAISRYHAGCQVVAHEAGPDLVGPCLVHGWHQLRRIENDQIGCACGRELESAS